MLKEMLIGQLSSSKEYFDRSTRNLEESHAAFRPADDAMSTVEHIAHVGQTVDWFLDGVTNNGQFDMDFENHLKDVKQTKTLADARAWVDKSYAEAIAYIQNASAEDLEKPFPEGPIMGGLPRYISFFGIVEHTAHHRGALTVYARMQGVVPPLPYMETQPA